MTAMLYAAGAAVVVVLGILWRLLGNAKKSGVDQQLAAEKRARDENLKRIKDAGAARPVGGVSDDPHNLDR